MPPAQRDLNAESVYEFGARAGVMRLLRLFDEYEVKTTWFAAALPAVIDHRTSAALAQTPRGRIGRGLLAA